MFLGAFILELDLQFIFRVKVSHLVRMLLDGDVCFASKKSSEREFFVPDGMHLGRHVQSPYGVS